MKQRKQIQSRPKQRRRLEADHASLLEGRKLSRKEVEGLVVDEFSVDGLSLMLSPDPGYSKEVLCRAIKWLNAARKDDDDRDFVVRDRWNEFEGYVRAWREKMRLKKRNSADRHARREAETLLTLANAWAAGDLPAVRRCVECTTFFLAARSNQQFCKGECRSDFYHNLETLHPEYKERKKREAVRRRKKAKERELRQYVWNIISMYGKMPKTQLEEGLAVAARKFKVTLAVVKRIAQSLLPTKDRVLLAKKS